MTPMKILRAAAVLALLAACLWLLIFSGVLSADAQIVPIDPAVNSAFQQVFWEERPLDLAVQACLIIAGALGVAALLPAEDEE